MNHVAEFGPKRAEWPLATGSILVLMTLFLPMTLDSCGDVAGPGYELALARNEHYLPTWSGMFLGPIPGRVIYLAGLALALTALVIAIPGFRARGSRKFVKIFLAISGCLSLLVIGDFFSLVQFDFLSRAFDFVGISRDPTIVRCLMLPAFLLIAWGVRSPFLLRQGAITWLFALGSGLGLVAAAEVGKVRPSDVINTGLATPGPIRNLVLLTIVAALIALAGCLRWRVWQKAGVAGWALTILGIVALCILLEGLLSWLLVSLGLPLILMEGESSTILFGIPLILLPVSLWYKYRIARPAHDEWPKVARGLRRFYVPAAVFSLAYLLLHPLMPRSETPWGFAAFFVGLPLIFRGFEILQSVRQAAPGYQEVREPTLAGVR